MEEQTAQLSTNLQSRLEIIFSLPGAVIFVCFTILFIASLFAFSSNFRGFFSNRNIKLGVGDKQFEMSPTDQVPFGPSEEENTALVKPPVAEEDSDAQGIESGAPVDERPLEGDDDTALHQKMFIAGFVDRDPENIEAIYQKWIALEDRDTSNETVETTRAQMRLTAGVQAGEAELKELEQNNLTWTEPSSALAKYYEKLERFDLAIPHAQKAVDRSESEDEAYRARMYMELAHLFVKQGIKAEALKALNKALTELSENSVKASILDKIAEIHETENNKFNNLKSAKILERALKLDPSDKSRRFKLAYNYLNNDNHHLALYHYKILTEQDSRYPSALNNLGVIYDKLELHGKCIEAWRRAANSGEGHPMGNLANRLIKNGFLEEARKVLSDASPELKNDPQMVGAVSFIKSTNDHENSELNEHLEAMKIRHKYMLLAAEAEQNPEPIECSNEDLVGAWTSSAGIEMQVSLAEAEGLVVAEWTEVGHGGGFGGLLGGASPPWQNKFKMNLRMNGLVLMGTALLVSQQVPNTVLSGVPKNREYFIVVTSNREMRGIYWSEYKQPHEVTFTRS